MAGTFGAAFAGARPLAQHCAELTARGPRPEERVELIAGWCRDLGQALAVELGQLFSGGKLVVTVSGPETMRGTAVFERIGPVAANSLLRCGEDMGTILLSLDFATAIALTESSFGGGGDLPADVPPQLPRSAALMVEQCAQIVAQAMARSRDGGAGAQGDALVRSDSVTRLRPFAADADVACFAVRLALGSVAHWELLLAVANDQLDGLLPGPDRAHPVRGEPRFGAAPASGAFAAMPLPLQAVLGEFELSLGQLEGLRPGDEIPLAIPVELPLRVGGEVFAHGRIGTFDNRMALRLTRLGGALTQPREIAA